MVFKYDVFKIKVDLIDLRGMRTLHLISSKAIKPIFAYKSPICDWMEWIWDK